MYIAPSILSADFGNLAKELKDIQEAGCDLLHIDIMDGHYVPNLTFGTPILNAIKKYSNTPLDVHLMVNNIEFFVDLILPYKPKFISFHIENANHPLRLISYLRENNINPGIVLNPHTPISSLEHILSEVDLVLLMAVNPGFGGQKFMPLVVDKVRELRAMIDKLNFKCFIEVDGGINGLNARDLQEAGADILVAGNFIFSSNSYKEAIKALKFDN